MKRVNEFGTSGNYVVCVMRASILLHLFDMSTAVNVMLYYVSFSIVFKQVFNYAIQH